MFNKCASSLCKIGIKFKNGYTSGATHCFQLHRCTIASKMDENCFRNVFCVQLYKYKKLNKMICYIFIALLDFKQPFQFTLVQVLIC